MKNSSKLSENLVNYMIAWKPTNFERFKNYTIARKPTNFELFAKLTLAAATPTSRKTRRSRSSWVP